MDNKSATLLIVLVAVLLLIISIILFISCWFLRKKRRFNQSQIFFNRSRNENTLLLTPRSQINAERTQIDDRPILLTCHFYIRTTGDYTFHSQLPPLGANPNKSWFLLNQTTKNTVASHLLTIQPKSDRLNQLNDEESSIAYIKTLNNLFNRLYHPYVEPMNKLDILYAQKLVVTIKQFQRSGSLKDLIENVLPTVPYDGKYSNNRPGLSLERVRMYSYQILEGLLFLQSKSIPPLVDLHSGNVIVSGSCLQIGSYEYQFLEQHSRIYSFVKRATSSVTLANGMTRPQACEVFCFGGLVFEMLTGYELGANLRNLTPTNWHDCGRDPDARDMLARIFDTKQPILTLTQIRELPYFSKNPIKLKELQDFKPIHGDYSNDVRNLLEQWTDTMKKKRASTGRTSNAEKRTSSVTPKPALTPTSVINLNYTPTIPPPTTTSSKPSNPPPSTTTTTTTVSTPATPPPAPSTSTVSQAPTPAPPPPPPPPPAPAPPPPPSGGSGDRSALLDNIRMGTTLKKTVTNDRSKPKFK